MEKKCYRSNKTEASWFEPTKIIDFKLLQVTNIGDNNNKYYCIEIQEGSGQFEYRIHTHYGRTDDLSKNGSSGQMDVRHFHYEEQCLKYYHKLIRDKNLKGYLSIDVVNTKVGSDLLSELLLSQARTESKKKKDSIGLGNKSTPLKLTKKIENLVRIIFTEATEYMTASIDVKITSYGFATALGVLSETQVAKGEELLDSIGVLLNTDEKKLDENQLKQLSGQFYSQIPHKFGRSKIALQKNIINNVELYYEKKKLLQVMKDMLKVSELFDPAELLNSGPSHNLYRALHCKIKSVPKSKFESLEKIIMESCRRNVGMKIKHIYSLQKEGENHKRKVMKSYGNEKLLFHGSHVSNWMGLLSRGLMMPSSVIKNGGKRTNFGWLGSGIYFSDMACASTRYSSHSREGRHYMLVSTVALGKVKTTKELMASLTKPPLGYDSVQGLSNVYPENADSIFEDNEYVCFDENAIRSSYFVEFECNLPLPPPPFLDIPKELEASKSNVVESFNQMSPVRTPTENLMFRVETGLVKTKHILFNNSRRLYHSVSTRKKPLKKSLKFISNISPLRFRRIFVAPLIFLSMSYSP